MCNDFKAGAGERFMDELAATAKSKTKGISTPCAAPRWPPNYGEHHALMTQSGPWRLGLLE
jgi:hypothetical protein